MILYPDNVDPADPRAPFNQPDPVCVRCAITFDSTPSVASHMCEQDAQRDAEDPCCVGCCSCGDCVHDLALEKLRRAS